MKKISVKRVVMIAIFSALTTLLYIYVKFPLPIFPSFLDVNISMIPVIICAFVLGPIDASICVLIRFLLKLPLTSTMYVGELADLIMGLGTAIPCAFIYKSNCKYKTLFSFISVPVMWVGLGIITNIYINIPFYIDFYFDGDMTPLLGMCTDAFKLISFGRITNITFDNFMLYYILLAVIPFNLLLSIIVIVITAPLHKRLRIVYDKICPAKNENDNLIVCNFFIVFFLIVGLIFYLMFDVVSVNIVGLEDIVGFTGWEALFGYESILGLNIWIILTLFLIVLSAIFSMVNKKEFNIVSIVLLIISLILFICNPTILVWEPPYNVLVEPFVNVSLTTGFYLTMICDVIALVISILKVLRLKKEIVKE